MKITEKVTKETVVTKCYKCDSCKRMIAVCMFRVKRIDFPDYGDDGKRKANHLCSATCLSEYLSKSVCGVVGYNISIRQDFAPLMAEALSKGAKSVSDKDFPDWWHYAQKELNKKLKKETNG